MKLACFARWSLLTCGVGSVLFFVVPAETSAFSTIGFTLGLAQRDVRVFDNFGGSGGTPDPNWPGYIDAPLAIWKAVAEWGSELHGDGSGDPGQPGDVGSGGANFDSTWQGLAPDPGPIDGNVVSETMGCGGGMLASTELGPNGWRILLCSSWTWHDGPNTNIGSGNNVDIQGVVCHEFGHVLGLGHSTVPGSTMFASISGNGSPQRSIEADDKAGLQFLYGVKSASKPRITAVGGTTTVTITGANFAPTNNEVWFTEVGLNPTGEPVKVIGLPSTAGGMQIALPLPANAGPGDVLVRRPGTSGAVLSNAFPFAPNGCGMPTSYCTGKTNSQGCTPAIGFTGQPSATSPTPFLITASGTINQKTGLLLYAFATAATPFQGGTLCLGSPLRRTSAQNSGGNAGPDDCSGTFSFNFNARIQNGIDPALVVGANVDAQYYYRDPADSFAVGLTDALALTICP